MTGKEFGKMVLNICKELGFNFDVIEYIVDEEYSGVLPEHYARCENDIVVARGKLSVEMNLYYNTKLKYPYVLYYYADRDCISLEKEHDKLRFINEKEFESFVFNLLSLAFY